MKKNFDHRAKSLDISDEHNQSPSKSYGFSNIKADLLAKCHYAKTHEFKDSWKTCVEKIFIKVSHFENVSMYNRYQPTNFMNCATCL